MTTRKRIPLFVLFGVLVGFFISGCYTQLAKPGLNRDADYADDYYYEDEYDEEAQIESEADSTVYHQHDVYVHGAYHDPYYYDFWWDVVDPYYYYPSRFYFSWRWNHYYDPWYSSYPYWGDPWYWTPFSHYGGWAYYDSYWGRPYYYYTYDNYYSKRPFSRRRTFNRTGLRTPENPRMISIAKDSRSGLARTAKTAITPDGRRSVSRTSDNQLGTGFQTVRRTSRSGDAGTSSKKAVTNNTKTRERSTKASRTSRRSSVSKRSSSSSKESSKAVKRSSRNSSSGSKSTVKRSSSSSRRSSSISRSSGSSSRSSSSGSSSRGSSSTRKSGGGSSRKKKG